MFISTHKLNWINFLCTLRFWKYAAIGLIGLMLSFWFFTLYIHRVQNDAIEHYLCGDYELIEIKVNNQVIDSYYQLIEIDYD